MSPAPALLGGSADPGGWIGFRSSSSPNCKTAGATVYFKTKSDKSGTIDVANIRVTLDGEMEDTIASIRILGNTVAPANCTTGTNVFHADPGATPISIAGTLADTDNAIEFGVANKTTLPTPVKHDLALKGVIKLELLGRPDVAAVPASNPWTLALLGGAAASRRKARKNQSA